MSRLFSGTPFERPTICPNCGRFPAECQCANLILPPKKKMSDRGKPAAPAYQLTPENSAPPKDQVAQVRIDRRKGNREVTVIAGLDHPGNDLARLLTDLKSLLGCGGSLQARTVELQGDHAARVVAALEAKGLRVRLRK